MELQVTIRSAITDSGSFVWWADSPDIPGFSATDESLQSLMLVTEMAIADVAEENGWSNYTIRYELEELTSQGDDLESHVDWEERVA
ncbi:MAG: DUF1902 domain-containing protein [Actinomycetota bacterium]